MMARRDLSLTAFFAVLYESAREAIYDLVREERAQYFAHAPEQLCHSFQLYA